MATIKHHDGHKTPPILTPGTLSPAILAQLIQYFNSYFNKCKINNADKVKNILLSFQDIKIKNCINNNIEVLQGADYTFDTFTSELRKHFLNPHWEHSIVRTVVNSQMTSRESFSTFANRVMEGNNLLIGTTSRLDSTALRTRDSDTESSNSTVSPISVPHYIWHANVHGVSELPTPVDCLLDNGAHLVLIRPETVADLGLKIQKLHKPQLATVAIKSKRHTFHLFDYVHLTLSSLNNTWTSQPVRALIAADLCTNILLGLPFLKHNKIVIDHDSDTD